MLLGVVLALVATRAWVIEPYVVCGTSMWPTHADGDYLLVHKLSVRFLPLARGDVVVFTNPLQPRTRLIKRVVALPGETVTIEDGGIRVENAHGGTRSRTNVPIVRRRKSKAARLTLAPGQFFLLGDHRFASVDSRHFGPIGRESIEGRVMLGLGKLPSFLRRWSCR